MPGVTVGGEDAVAEEVFPVVVEREAFAVVGELRCEDGFDVLGVGAEEAADADYVGFYGVVVRGGIGEEDMPGFEVAVVDGVPYCAADEVDTPRSIVSDIWRPATQGINLPFDPSQPQAPFNSIESDGDQKKRLDGQEA